MFKKDSKELSLIEKTEKEMKRLEEQTIKAVEDSIRERKNLLEEAIMTINQIQDIQAIGITEKEKDIMRNNIINCKRSEYVQKLIELDNLSQSI